MKYAFGIITPIAIGLLLILVPSSAFVIGIIELSLGGFTLLLAAIYGIAMIALKK